MSEKQPLDQSLGGPRKRGFEDLECYKLALDQKNLVIKRFTKKPRIMKFQQMKNLGNNN